MHVHGQIFESVDTHRILRLILDRQLTLRPHIGTVKTKRGKRLNLLRHHLAGTQWEADQSTLPKIHKMLFESAMEFGSAAYGSTRKTQLKKCVAYPQGDFLFIKLLTSLLNKCKKDFQFHIKTTESKFFYTKYKIFFTWLIWISRFWAFMTPGCISDPIKDTFLSSA
jgi:hypothetical protein